jgi:hypothetical protein
MKIEESEQLEPVITLLDVQLITGYSELQEMKKEGFDTNLFKDNHKLEATTKKIQNALQKWADDTLKILKVSTGKYYYQYHFLDVRGDGMCYPNVPEKISNAVMRWEHYLRKLEEIIFRLEDERNLKVRREIAEIENQADILYEVKYSEHSREIKLNSILLAKPDFESENERLFTYVYSKQNEPIKVSDIEGYYKIKFKKSISDIIRDLGFKGKTRQVFFPVADKNKVMFTNPISKKYFIENDLPVISMVNLRDTARDSELQVG